MDSSDETSRNILIDEATYRAIEIILSSEHINISDLLKGINAKPADLLDFIESIKVDCDELEKQEYQTFIDEIKHSIETDQTLCISEKHIIIQKEKNIDDIYPLLESLAKFASSHHNVEVKIKTNPSILDKSSFDLSRVSNEDADEIKKLLNDWAKDLTDSNVSVYIEELNYDTDIADFNHMNEILNKIY